MAKHIVHDVIPPEKRSIRNIPLPERRVRTVRAPKKKAPEAEVETIYEEPAPRKSHVRSDAGSSWESEPRAKRKVSRKGLWIGVLIAMFALALAVSSLFSGAEANVTPRQATVEVNTTFAASSAGTEEAVPFEIVKVTRDGGKTVTASKEENVEKRATGRIVIYNNHSSASQRLVKNTRFETKDGLIFRIADSVEVPGARIEGGEKIPGSVEVTVTADQAGDKYNIDPADFTIPGFKGDPRYETFYARSKTPMTGGFSGMMKVVSPDTLAEAKDEIQTTLRADLLKDLAAQIPHNYAMFDAEDGLAYEFTDLPQTSEGGNSAKVNMQGVLYAIIFNKSALGGAIAEKYLSDYNGGVVDLDSTVTLSFAIEDEGFNYENGTAFNFTLNGTAHLIWQYDEAALREDLRGAEKRDVNRILGKYPAIESAEVVVRPFWNRSLPNDAQKIKIRNMVGGTE